MGFAEILVIGIVHRVKRPAIAWTFKAMSAPPEAKLRFGVETCDVARTFDHAHLLSGALDAPVHHPCYRVPHMRQLNPPSIMNMGPNQTRRFVPKAAIFSRWDILFRITVICMRYSYRGAMGLI
jgi:hypothetical protein